MFGLPLYSEVLHTSARLTWNCVAHTLSSLWHLVLGQLGDNMPRSRRRHHSRSRSRSHSPDREAKRRRVESYDSVHNSRRSVSSEPEANTQNDSAPQTVDPARSDTDVVSDGQKIENVADASRNVDASALRDDEEGAQNASVAIDESMDITQSDLETSHAQDLETTNADDSDDASSSADPGNESLSAVPTDLKSAVQKPLTPKQQKLHDEWAAKRRERQQAKEERARKREEERLEAKRKKDEVLRQKQAEKEEALRQRQLEKEAKELKLREEREAKQREKEMKIKERDNMKEEKDAKRKEKEAERQREEEKKQKAAAAFTKFFVASGDTKKESSAAKQHPEQVAQVAIQSAFMPFQLKSDMRLAPTTRNLLTTNSKEMLDKCLLAQDAKEIDLYLRALNGVTIRKSGKTWIEDAGEDEDSDDVVIISDLGESISKPNAPAPVKMRAHYLKFHENRRPPYFGTWRKKSKVVTGRRPWGLDELLAYDVDSDDEWEEEEEGEDIAGSDDEEKEPDSENDYEVDNDFFVPHGHLSDDEGNDEESINPELRKAKEKLLKHQFDAEMKLQTQRLKPRVIGCVWYSNNNNDDGKVDAAIDTFLQPFAIISNGVIPIRKRSDIDDGKGERVKWQLDKELMPCLLQLLHGNVKDKKVLVEDFFEYVQNAGVTIVKNKNRMYNLIRRIAKRQKCPKDSKWWWIVKEDVREEYPHVALTLPNQWPPAENLIKPN